MAANQAELHKLGRIGEELARTVCKGRRTTHKAPFDYVDHFNKVAYEVKTVTGNGNNLKIHIMETSYKRKLAYVAKHNLEAVLVVLVVYPKRVDIYTGKLTQWTTFNQLTKVRSRHVVLTTTVDMPE